MQTCIFYKALIFSDKIKPLTNFCIMKYLTKINVIIGKSADFGDCTLSDEHNLT